MRPIGAFLFGRADRFGDAPCTVIWIRKAPTGEPQPVAANAQNGTTANEKHRGDDDDTPVIGILRQARGTFPDSHTNSAT
jgi:hypothetical protein